jgi:MFS transporter, YNFM family, putative membrane transport protein
MRRMFVLMYALVFLDEVALLGLVPLLPGYTRVYDLSTAEAGALLSAAPLAIVVASIPAGRLSDGLGSRRVTLAAGVLIVASTAAMAVANGFAVLLAARFAFGLASGTIWSAGLAWIGDSAPAHRRSAALGTVITTAGVGGMAGPVFCGYLAEHVGRGAPWAILSGATVLVVLALLAANPGRSVAHEHAPLRLVADKMRREPLLAGAVAIMLLGGVGDGIANLIAPLQLADNGLSEGRIGLWFSVGAALFIVASAATTRMGERAVSLRAAAYFAAFQAAILLPVLVSSATAVIVFMLLARFAVAALPYTIGYPLAAVGSARLGLGTGTVNGLLGLIWGAGSFVAPPVAGVIADAVGDQAAYALLVGFCLLMAGWLLRSAQRGAVPAAAAAS